MSRLFTQTTLWGVVVTALVGSMASHAQAEEPLREFRIAGYLPDYRAKDFDLSRADGVTDLILFSAEPTAEGGLDLSRLEDVPWTAIRDWKGATRARVILCVGGWERSQAFGAMAKSPKKRAEFAKSALAICRERDLDGVDIDWEHPADAAEQEGYAALLQELAQRLRPAKRTLSVTMAAWQPLPKAGLDAVDWVHVMAYDHDGEHATFKGATADVAKLRDAGAPVEKITLGLPFYGRDLKNRDRALTYAEIVALGPHPSEKDLVDGVYFNGPGTIARKTSWSIENGLAGVMFWELGQDAVGEASLLRVIRDSVRKTPPTATIVATQIARDFVPDGRLTEDAWKNAAPATIELRTQNARPVPELATSVRALWSERYLYLGYDAPFRKLTTFGEKQAEERFGLWDKDVLEAFIGGDPEHVRRYTEYEWAPNGDWIDLKLTDGEADFAWNSGHEFTVQVDAIKKRWTVEVRIPLESLSTKRPKRGDRWRINLYRHDKASGQIMAWSPTFNDTFHTPERFGWLEFGE